METHETHELTFQDGPESLSALVIQPPTPSHLLALAHGAGADMRHRHMQHLAEHLAQRGIATFRYNFRYTERGRRRVDAQAVALGNVRAAWSKANELALQLNVPLLAGGHSYGGRMSSHVMAEGPHVPVRALILFSFPLHRPGSPSAERAAHFERIALPTLFLSGTRDDMAESDLLESTAGAIGQARVHRIDTANHGFVPLKRSRKATETVYEEAARVAVEWINSQGIR